MGCREESSFPSGATQAYLSWDEGHNEADKTDSGTTTRREQQSPFKVSGGASMAMGVKVENHASDQSGKQEDAKMAPGGTAPSHNTLVPAEMVPVLFALLVLGWAMTGFYSLRLRRTLETLRHGGGSLSLPPFECRQVASTEPERSPQKFMLRTDLMIHASGPQE